jgi:hypothetical protein
VRTLLLITFLYPAFALVGCHAFRPKPPPAPNTTGPFALGPLAAPHQVTLRRNTVERLEFHLDSSRSSGLIATTLDPLHLGARHSRSRCPLQGTITAKLTTSPDGTRSLALDSINLATSTNTHLKYDWTHLIGSIRGIIPSGILTIKHHTFSGPLKIDSRGAFRRPGYRFKVGGVCRIQGHGLLLKKLVGQSEESLTIAKTKPVVLDGTLVRRAGKWILEIPATVLKERFELDPKGSTLDLVFTGKITAVAR